MKNIHILPTDKPSNLHFTEFEELVFTPKYKKLDGVNIYITSNEEIKIGDWCITAKGNLLQMIEGDTVLGFALLGCKKIILMTDQDLIKDGVQAIDDEFLEWFVKNPSCEFVEVTEYLDSGFSYGYKIIIPKEIGFKVGNGKRTETFYQETLEEVAERIYPLQKNSLVANNKKMLRRAAWVKGAKWQQEQICTSEFIQRIRATKSDAEARRIIREQFKNK